MVGFRVLPDLGREEATEALCDALREMMAGRDPLRDRGLARRYVGAVAQWVAPRMVAMAQSELDRVLDELDAISIVVTQLEVECAQDTRREADGREGVLSRIVGADDPLRYLIRCATKIPNPESPRLTDRVPGWVYKDLIPRRKQETVWSFDQLQELGVELESTPTETVDMEGWAAMAAHAFDLLRPETPLTLWDPVQRMVEWCVSATPVVHASQEHNRENVGASRLRQAEELFPELTAAQVDAVYKVLWGGLPDRQASSLLAHVALVRNAHQYGEHDQDRIFARNDMVGAVVERVRNVRARCVGCNTTPIAGDRLRALVDTYASRMIRSLKSVA